MDKDILRKWLKAGYMEKDIVHATTEGTPQGGVISPLLANLALDGLGKLLLEKYPKKISSRKTAYKVNFIRYADDFVITGRSKEILEEEILPLVEQFLKERCLRLSKSKTRITHINEGFDFLGQTIRKYDGKLLITPSKISVKRFLESIRVFVKRNKMMAQHPLIENLNRKIRGWCQYHRHVVSKKTFSNVRHELWKILWNWSCSRHKDKGAQWIKDRYFHHDGKCDWCFSCNVKDSKSGEERLITLYDPSRVPIIRHIKIRSECNPHDPVWKKYIEKRHHLRMKKIINNEKVWALWERQRGECPICKQSISMEVAWDKHHIVPKREGGKDNLENLILLHMNCHKQVHNKNGRNCEIGS